MYRTFTRLFSALFVLFAASFSISAQSVVINEFDADSPDIDDAEFIELFGTPNLSLDGHLIVRYNGSDDASYGEPIDLNGFSLNADGFFLIGGANVPGADITFGENELQNGADAIVLLQGLAADYPEDSPVANVLGVVDAVVYDTADADDMGLLPLINMGQPQVDEDSNGMKTSQSNARIPDGGMAQNTDTYVQQIPTPGASNVIVCLGGELDSNLGTDFTICQETTETSFTVTSTGVMDGDATYVYVVTDENNIIIETSATNVFDFSATPEGICRVWGLSYTGMLDATTAEAGDDATMVMTDGDCLSLSTNFITVERVADCSAQCDGGMLSTTDGEMVTVCLDDVNTSVTVETTGFSSQTISYAYVITDESNLILDLSTSNTIDFGAAPAGVCRVWGVSYDGELVAETVEVGDDATMAMSDGNCLALSSNFIQVTREVCATCDAGTVATADGETQIVVCLDDEADVITFQNTSLTPDASYNYVITDEANLIIAVLADGVSDFDFNGADAGVCRLWGLSYTGVLDATTIEAGDDATMVVTDGDCLELSANFIEVSRVMCDSSEPCSELFFSEYIEGSGDNKALEIYNPTDAPIDMSLYQLVNCGNGCNEPGMWDFTNAIFDGITIMPQDVIVVGHPNAAAEIADVTDVSFQFLSNGDDVFALMRIADEAILDIIGEQGDDPGQGWEVNGVADGTRDHTLVRQQDIQSGSAVWTYANTTWDVYDQNDFSFIGSHLSSCGVTADIPQVNFVGTMTSVEESAMDVCVAITVSNAVYASSFTVDVTGGSAENGTDYNLIVPADYPFEMSDMDETLEICIPLTDDMIAEGDETIELTISSATDDIEITFGTYTVTILDDDTPLPIYPIAQVTTISETGVADSLNVECEIQGTVYGVNLNGGGIQFTIIDETGGIGLFSGNDYGYTVTEGDNVAIRGSISQFNGLTQISPDTVIFQSAGNPLIDPTVVTELNEFSESNLVSLECVSLVDPAQWTGSGSGFNVDVTDGTNTYAVRIDNEVDLYSMPAPEGTFTITGIGGQFDPSEPFDSGYQLFPRYVEDISDFVVAPNFAYDENLSTNVTFEQGCVVSFGTGQAGFSPDDTSFASYEWQLQDQVVTGVEGVFNIQDLGLMIGTNTLVLTLIVTDSNGCVASTSSEVCINVFFSVEETNAVTFTAFPNPAQDQLHIQSAATIEQVSIYNLAGQLISADVVRDGTQTQVNVSQLAQGTYLVEVTTAQGAARSTFVKQ